MNEHCPEETHGEFEAQETHAPARKLYTRPSLVDFGSVRELTRGGTGALGDGGTRKAV